MEPSTAIPTIMLILTIAMPGQRPDIMTRLPMQTLEQCWSEAKAFVDAGTPEIAIQHGAIGVMAACAVKEEGRPKT